VRRFKYPSLVVFIAAVSTAAVWATQADKNEKIQSFLAAAQQAVARKDFPAAAASYRNAVQLSPQTAELWADLGLMCHEARDFPEAIKSFAEAARLNPSLYVPQLFLGIDNLELKHADAAIPFLEKAEKLNPADAQAPLMLGRAFAAAGNGNRASDAYSRVVTMDPGDGDAWLGLGMAYLQQVDYDARVMTSAYKNSNYTNLRAGELFAEQGKLVDAARAYKVAVSVASSAPCSHASYGIVLLRQKKIIEAKAELDREINAKSLCPLARLGFAALHLVQGDTGNALNELVTIWNADNGFLQESLPLLHDGVTIEQAQKLFDLAEARKAQDSIPAGFTDAIQTGLASNAPALAWVDNFDGKLPNGKQTPASPVPEDAEKLYLAGQFRKCGENMRRRVSILPSRKLSILAACGFYAGDYRTAALAARRLAVNVATRQIGMYWESKANERLATAALTRAGEINPNSPRMHVLLGDVYRQKRKWENAESEYHQALALDPGSRAGRLGLAIALFEDGNSRDALAANSDVLQKNPNDPEANLLAGEILVQQHEYVDAEVHLKKCRDIPQKLMPRLHALFGKVYARTGRDHEALSEFKLVTTGDDDGTIHYQMGRLYLKAGDKKAAAQAFELSRRLHEQWDANATLAIEQSATDISRQ